MIETTIKIGSHVGMKAPDYYLGSVKEALSYNANTFMFYTGSPTSSIRTPLENLKIKEAIDYMKQNNIDINNVVVHAPYLINLANLDEEKSEFAYSLLCNEINRTSSMGVRYLVLHPGSSLDYDRDKSIDHMAFLLNKAINNNPYVTILIETMAGKGKEIGSCFEEVSYMIKKIDKKECIGVCLDTCHINDAGYDFNNPKSIIDEFDKIIGLDYLKVIHVNDSKNPRASHKDRHENIGYGTLGYNNIISFIYDERIKDKIFILETPYINDKAPYKFEIESIRNKTFNKNLIEDVTNN